MKVLIACEESQTVCKAFRERGHEGLTAATYKSRLAGILSGTSSAMHCKRLRVGRSQQWMAKRTT